MIAKDKIRKAMSYLLTFAPYDAFILYQLQLKHRPDMDAIMGVTVDKLYYNEKFFEDNPLETKELAFILKHEARHILYNHIARRNYIVTKTKSFFSQFGITDEDFIIHTAFNVWNSATDMAINSVLLCEDSGFIKPPVHGTYPHSKSFKEKMNAEYYFDILFESIKDEFSKRKEEEKKKNEKEKGGAEGDDQEGSDEGASDESLEREEDQEGDCAGEEGPHDNCETDEEGSFGEDEGEGESPDGESTEPSGGSDKGPDCDNEIYEQSRSESFDESEVISGIEDVMRDVLPQDGADGNPCGTVFIEEETEDNITDSKSLAVCAEESMRSSGYDLPTHIEEVLHPVVPKQINWKQELRMLMDTNVRGKANYKKPNRRYGSKDIIFPYRKEKSCEHTAFAIDMSYSIGSSVLSEFYESVTNILLSLKVRSARFMTFTSIVTSNEMIKPSDIEKLKSERRFTGGTSILPVIKDAVKYKIKNLIIFSDCISSDLEACIELAKKNDIKLIWCWYMNDPENNAKYIPTGMVLKIREN